jgi:hypothetical protein
LYWQDISKIEIPQAHDDVQNECERLFRESEEMRKQSEQLRPRSREKPRMYYGVREYGRKLYWLPPKPSIMPVHSAQSLFDQNISSAKDCLRLYDGLSKLKIKMNLKWLLRAAVVFAVSALDTYFHDKVKYRVGRFSLNDLPLQLANFEIPIRELTTWEEAQRKGNVLRNWVTDYLGVRPRNRPRQLRTL